jgi:drug/metabolite transporter (DMT)-like permease
MWGLLAISSVFYIPLLISTGVPDHFGSGFWPAVIARLFIDSAATLLFLKALQISELSVAVPMLSLTPIFVIFTSAALNHVWPTVGGVIGTLIVVGGVYALHFTRGHRSWTSPFRNIASHKGTLIILLVCVLWSFVAPLKRVGIDNSSVSFYTAFFQIFWAICFTPIAIWSDRHTFARLWRWSNLKKLLPVGALDAAQIWTQNIALSLTLPVYTSTVRSTSILFAAIFGHYFFKEKLKGKLVPSLIIMVGLATTALTKTH